MPEYVITVPAGVTALTLADGRNVPIRASDNTARIISDISPQVLFWGDPALVGSAVTPTDTVSQPGTDSLPF